jgi:hypothetical protein
VDGTHESEMLACCVVNLANNPAIACDPRLAGNHFEYHSRSPKINQRLPRTSDQFVDGTHESEMLAQN